MAPERPMDCFRLLPPASRRGGTTGHALPRLAAAMLLLAAAPTLAHDGGHGVVDRIVGSGGIAVEFYLPDGPPLVDVAFELFEPGQDRTPFQTGRTDRLGRAVFMPDRPGIWRITLNDAQGRAASSTIEVGADDLGAQQPWRRWLLRLSLLINCIAVALAWHFWLRQRCEPATHSGEAGDRLVGKRSPASMAHLVSTMEPQP